MSYCKIVIAFIQMTVVSNLKSNFDTKKFAERLLIAEARYQTSLHIMSFAFSRSPFSASVLDLGPAPFLR